MIDYPTEMPLQAITELVNMLRTKNVDKSEFGLALWNVQGYAQSKLLGTVNKVMGSVNQTPSDAEVLEHLTQLSSHAMGSVFSLDLSLSIILKWCLMKALNNL